MADEAVGEPPADGENGEVNPEEEEEEVLPPPCMDLSEYLLKTDHFEKMHVLKDEGKVEGAPNWRQVNGFPVHGTAQPTEAALKVLLEKLHGAGSKSAEADQATLNKVVWYDMRQEPVIYINGMPFAPRAPGSLHENLEVENVQPTSDLVVLAKHFVNILKERSEADGTLKVHKDSAYTENPMERDDIEESIKVDSLMGLPDLLKGIKTEEDKGELSYVLVPVVEERAPDESCFDILVDSLKNEPASTQCVFSCQMGRGRTTLGMVVACLIKEIQVTSELRRMAEIELVAKSVIDNLIVQKFEAPLPKCQDDDDPFIKGEFDVVKELLEKVPEAVEGKRKVDRIIDICGGAPKGTGLQNLRECIIETKWKYDVAPEDKQVVWKRMILNFMERYFYLICFATYSLEVGKDGFQTSFKQWMDAKPYLRAMIEEGKDKLEWYRQVDPAKLNTLKDLINAPNYKDNLSTLIRTIYEFAFLTYADLPRGPIKNNSMRKLAAKTLMEILPSDIGQEIQKKLDEHSSSPDFLTLIGLVSYHGKED